MPASMLPIHVLKTIFMYLLALFLVRLMGKRALGEMSLFDFVIMAGVGDVIVVMGLDRKASLWVGITILIIFTILERAFSWLTSRYHRLGRLIEGSPTIIVRDGKVLESNLQKEHLSRADLSQEMRGRGIKNLDQIELGVFEASGKFSFILKEDQAPDFQGNSMGEISVKLNEMHDVIHKLVAVVEKNGKDRTGE
ncbi:MAG: DUF421 domain-containing protein [Bacillota bacterium]